MKKLILILLVFAGMAFSQTAAKINKIGGSRYNAPHIRAALNGIATDAKTVSGVWTFSDSAYIDTLTAAKITVTVLDCTRSCFVVSDSAFIDTLVTNRLYGSSGTLTLARIDAGTVTLTNVDNNANADFTIAAGGTGALTLGDVGSTSAILSSDWAIDNTGVATGLGNISTDGAIAQTQVNAASGSANPYDYTGTLGIMNGSDDFTLFDVNVTNANHTGVSNTVQVFDIGNITGDDDATENAVQIGTGWDLGLKVSSPVELNDVITLENDEYLTNAVNGTVEARTAVLKQSYDTEAYWTATVANGAGVTFDGTSDGTASFTFSDAVTFSAGINAGTSQAIVGTTAVTLGDNTQTWAVNSSDWDISTTGAISGVGSITSDGVFDQTIVDIAAGGDKAVNTSITQGSSALTGNLIAGAFVATNGTAAAADGVIYGIEAKARAATSAGTGNTIGRLTGVYASVDAKAKTATTMRAFEASLDGAAGGTSTEAVAFEAFNNSSATQTASYAFSANGGTASGHKVYTADMRMQNGGLFDNATDTKFEWNENSDELIWTFGSNTVAVTSGDVTLFNYGVIDVQSDKFAMNNGGYFSNPHADTLTVTESVFKVAGGLTFKNSPAISITKIVQSGVASGKERLKLTIGGVDYLLFAAADSADYAD